MKSLHNQHSIPIHSNFNVFEPLDLTLFVNKVITNVDRNKELQHFKPTKQMMHLDLEMSEVSIQGSVSDSESQDLISSVSRKAMQLDKPQKEKGATFKKLENDLKIAAQEQKPLELEPEDPYQSRMKFDVQEEIGVKSRDGNEKTISQHDSPSREELPADIQQDKGDCPSNEVPMSHRTKLIKKLAILEAKVQEDLRECQLIESPETDRTVSSQAGNTFRGAALNHCMKEVDDQESQNSPSVIEEVKSLLQEAMDRLSSAEAHKAFMATQDNSAVQQNEVLKITNFNRQIEEIREDAERRVKHVEEASETERGVLQSKIFRLEQELTVMKAANNRAHSERAELQEMFLEELDASQSTWQVLLHKIVNYMKELWTAGDVPGINE